MDCQIGPPAQRWRYPNIPRDSGRITAGREEPSKGFPAAELRQSETWSHGCELSARLNSNNGSGYYCQYGVCGPGRKVRDVKSQIIIEER